MTGDLEVAVAVAREAAGVILERRRAGVSVAATKTSATDVVTEADHAAEQLIARRLAELRPDDGLLGEEGADEPGTSGVRWVIDPIDGTVNYLYDLEWYAVSVAAERAGRVVAGAVVHAASGSVWAAARGEGATKDGRPIRVRAGVPREQRLVLTGFSYEVPIRTVQAAGVARVLPQIRDIRRFGSAAIDLCLVAEGKADGYVEEGPHLWDYAAGGLIAEEAGATVALRSGASGRPAVVAAPTDTFEDFATLVADCGLVAD